MIRPETQNTLIMLRKTLLTAVLALAVSTTWAQAGLWNTGPEGNNFKSKSKSLSDLNRERVVYVQKQNAYEHAERINGAQPPQNPYVFAGTKPQFSSTTRIGWHLFLGYTFVRNLVTD